MSNSSFVMLWTCSTLQSDWHHWMYSHLSCFKPIRRTECGQSTMFVGTSLGRQFDTNHRVWTAIITYLKRVALIRASSVSEMVFFVQKRAGNRVTVARNSTVQNSTVKPFCADVPWSSQSINQSTVQLVLLANRDWSFHRNVKYLKYVVHIDEGTWMKPCMHARRSQHPLGWNWR